MKSRFISINAPVSDWINDNGQSHEEIDETLIRRWAIDVVNDIITDEQLTHKIALLDVDNFKASIPEDFSMFCQLAYKLTPPEKDCSRKERISQFVQGTLEKDCHLEINLICPDCHKTKCDCSTNVIEVDVDRIWEMANPQYQYGYMSHFTRTGRWGYGEGSYLSPHFKILRYASNDYFNSGRFIPNCVNTMMECEHSFTYDFPYIDVSFQKGELLLSYLGKKLDRKGDPMVPNCPSLLKAIYFYIESKWWWKAYRKSDKNADLQRYSVADGKYSKNFGRAMSELGMPEFREFYDNYLMSTWCKRIPQYTAELQSNKRVRDQYDKYSDIMR